MALLREGISVGNNYVDQIKAASKELSEIGNDIITYLNGNANFQMFREGTDKGEKIYNDLDKCVNTIVEQLVPSIDKIAMSTSNLLNKQNDLNKANMDYYRKD